MGAKAAMAQAGFPSKASGQPEGLMVGTGWQAPGSSWV